MDKQGYSKTKSRRRVTCHCCKNKGHFSYECKYKAPVLKDKSVVELNLKYNYPEEVTYFYFINLAEENPDASI